MGQWLELAVFNEELPEQPFHLSTEKGSSFRNVAFFQKRDNGYVLKSEA
jgi:hypothetical protein